MTFTDRVKDILERAGTSAGEVLLAMLGTLVVGHGIVNLPWLYLLSGTAGAFVVSLLLSLSQLVVGPTPFWVDVLLRAIRTFAASLLGSIGGVNTFDVVHFGWINALNIAAVATFLCVVKCFVSPNAHLSGSWLPTPVIARIHGVELPGGYSKAA